MHVPPSASAAGLAAAHAIAHAQKPGDAAGGVYNVTLDLQTQTVREKFKGLGITLWPRAGEGGGSA